jgi:hypothetical protein
MSEPKCKHGKTILFCDDCYQRPHRVVMSDPDQIDMMNEHELRTALRDEIKTTVALRSQLTASTKYVNNGIEVFMHPCGEHSGTKTPPFHEFMERYGNRCLICTVNALTASTEEVGRLRGEVEKLRKCKDGVRRAGDFLMNIGSDSPDDAEAKL